MANFDAFTCSNGVHIKDQEKLRALLRKYYVEPDAQIDDGIFGIWGYDWLNVYPKDADGNTDVDAEATDAFLEEFRDLLEPGQELVIHCIGHEALRFPLSAMSVSVTRDKVQWQHIKDSWLTKPE